MFLCHRNIDKLIGIYYDAAVKHCHHKKISIALQKLKMHLRMLKEGRFSEAVLSMAEIYINTLIICICTLFNNRIKVLLFLMNLE